jgi:hypothetical protein
MTDITPQYLDNLYDNLQKEQLNLLNKLKNRNPTEQDIEREITKQTTVITTIMLNVLKLKNIKQKLLLKNIA